MYVNSIVISITLLLTEVLMKDYLKTCSELLQYLISLSCFSHYVLQKMQMYFNHSNVYFFLFGAT